MKIHYFIVSPDYTPASAGIRMMHKLCHHLNESGYDAYINTPVVNPDWNEKQCPTNIAARIACTGIIVYPEVVKGNPLGAEIVVRYILNHPNLSVGEDSYGKDEIFFTCNGESLGRYVPSMDRVLCIPLIEDFFKDEGLVRQGGCFYVGKGRSERETINVPQRTIEITGMNRRQVAHILKTSEILYTYDNFTLLIEEAKKCGCPVFVVGGEVSKVGYDEYTKDFPKQLENFIRITQEEALKRLNKIRVEEFISHLEEYGFRRSVVEEIRRITNRKEYFTAKDDPPTYLWP